jgi:thiol-disulfide isomerase/thioredoxin
MQLKTHVRECFFSLLLVLIMQIGYSQADTYQPDFSLSMPDFQQQALAPKEEVWVLDFWATWCGPCIVAVPHMKDLHKRFAGKPVRFISLSWDQSAAKWLAGLDRLRMPWQHLLITPDLVPWFDQFFPHKGIPTAFVVRRTGQFKRVSDVYQLEKAINKALKP